MRRTLVLTSTFFCAAWLAAQAPQQGGTIVVGGTGVTRMAVPECVARAGDEPAREVCRTITQVLRNDLKFEGVFQFIPESLYSAVPPLNPDAPNFDDWKGVGANVLVTTKASVSGGDAAVEARVLQVDTRQMILQKRYSARTDNPRIFAHQISDEIMSLVENLKGVARTKIAFISDRDSVKGKVVKELYLMDYDGHAPRRATVRNEITILPNWAPDGRSIAQIWFRNGSPDIYLARIYEGLPAQNLTKGTAGQPSGLAFSPDGKRIAYSSTKSGNAEIWVANADGSGARKLTSDAAIDTAPCWSPTAQEIAFTSGRTGTPQLWIMDSEGLNLRRLSTVGNWNDGCSWNSQKPEIAFTSRINDEGGFEVAVIDLATRQVRQITEGRGSCEYPSWSPNGRHLVYSCRRGGNWQITVSDGAGRNVQTLAAGPGNNVYPDWGP